MAEIRVEPTRSGGAGRWMVPLLLLLAIAAAAYWYFGMRDGRATRDAATDTAVTAAPVSPSDTVATMTSGSTATTTPQP